MAKQFYTWTLEIKVHKSWVADGFNLTNERAKEMLENAIPYAYGHETKARVLTRPKDKEIATEQGYKTVKAFKKS